MTTEAELREGGREGGKDKGREGEGKRFENAALLALNMKGP